MKLLYIEDNALDIDLTVRALKKKAPHTQAHIAMSQTEALKYIKSPVFSEIDLVLTDMHLPDGDGIAILSHIRGHSIPVAVVLLTGQGDEEAAVSALKSGADDYVVKKQGYLETLPDRLEAALRSYQVDTNGESQQLKVLYLEHNLADIDFTRRHLAKHAPYIELEPLSKVNDFYEKLEQPDGLASYSALLLDYRLPQDNALEVIDRVKQSSSSNIPVILVTGKGDEEIAVKALKKGAFDYITKNQGYLFKLPSVIQNANYSMRLSREHEALLESEKRYRSLFENNHVVMMLIDPQNGAIVDANPMALDFYGYSNEALRTKTIYEINTIDATATEKEIETSIANEQTYCLGKHKLADGSIRDVEVYSGPITFDNKPLLCYTIYDISERIRSEREKEKLQKMLVQAQKMESIGTMAGGIAHDFNNILSSILGFTELALEEVENNSSIEDSLIEVRSAGKRAKDLVKQILAFARKTEEELRPVKLRTIIEEILHLLRSSIPTSIQIKTNFDSDGWVMGNATQLHQVVMNLCTNAAHAMEDRGGQITLSTKNVDFDQIPKDRHLKLNDQRYVQFKVSDTGSGISPDVIDSIFEPYFTTKEPGEGTGMGLAMVQGIVESYGGHMSVDSRLGEGTEFTIYLPHTIQSLAQPEDEPETLPTGIERILFIDDEASIVKMSSLMLESLGYKITSRRSSTEALELFKAQPADFDLVITDMTMPDMTGDELAIEMIKIRSDIPIILCTGFSKRISDEATYDLGIKALVSKPFVRADLARAVRNVLDEKKGGGCL